MLTAERLALQPMLLRGCIANLQLCWEQNSTPLELTGSMPRL
jgi:hypothetical protein